MGFFYIYSASTLQGPRVIKQCFFCTGNCANVNWWKKSDKVINQNAKKCMINDKKKLKKTLFL